LSYPEYDHVLDYVPQFIVPWNGVIGKYESDKPNAA